MSIKNRVKELRMVPACDLVENDKNWRRHGIRQREALVAAIGEIGMASAVIAREIDGRLEIIDGHLRADVMSRADELVPVLILDVDEFEANKLLATMDPIGAMADSDAGALTQLLDSVQFSDESLQQLVTSLAEKAGAIPAMEPLSESPVDFPEVDESINTDHRCPKCGYSWSGKSS